MNKIQILQNGDSRSYRVIVDGKDISNTVTSVNFPKGIQGGSHTLIVLTVLGEVEIDLNSANITVNENA